MSAIDLAAPSPARIAVPAAAAGPRPYASPYLAGVGIGLVLLLAYVTVGRGLGASGAFTSVAAAGVAAVAPREAAASPVLADYLGGARGPLADWLVVELIGVALGGYASARLAGRRRREVERGPRVSDRTRLLCGFGGGVVMGVGAKLARGCTSGQALTGGALLSVGSWIFIATAFAAAFAAAPLFRREWT
ncbi:MAG TPA: YeeE/YedE thiosulfate transporter family protein [Longimicrobium sp.]|nr:YeeE/YedE thiosulfate transporter family protein [Longimicrobium sp.]